MGAKFKVDVCSLPEFTSAEKSEGKSELNNSFGNM